jgi:two-component system chemotaxis response regulator CheY
MKREDKKRKCVMVVEDSKTMRDFIVSTIQSVGKMFVIECGTGFEALKMLPKYEFDMIITDINMPDINGLELITFLKNDEKYKHIPLIIISTEGSEKDIKKGLSLGAQRYLVKPFDPEELKKIVKEYLWEKKHAKTTF